jgi:hypothetical protein
MNFPFEGHRTRDADFVGLGLRRPKGMKGSSIFRKQTACTGVVAGYNCFDGRTKQNEKESPSNGWVVRGHDVCAATGRRKTSPTLF